MTELVVLLTACIAPKGADEHGLCADARMRAAKRASELAHAKVTHLVRADPEVRLADYRQALEFWLAYPDPRVRDVVLIDNSGYSLAALEQTAAHCNPLGKEVEFLRAKENRVPAGVHYGYAELGMVDEAVERSRLICGAKYFAKATGRLRFPGFSRLLDALPDEVLFAVDARRNGLFVRSPQRFITTQLMLFSTRFYRERLWGARGRMGPGATHAETLLWRELMALGGQAGAWLRWPCNCDPVGFAAHRAKDYGAAGQRSIYLLRALCRRLLPEWWV
jgi:hypothetical protein